jgi:hypothetical protein
MFERVAYARNVLIYWRARRDSNSRPTWRCVERRSDRRKHLSRLRNAPLKVLNISASVMHLTCRSAERWQRDIQRLPAGGTCTHRAVHLVARYDLRCSSLPERRRNTTFTLTWKAPDAQRVDAVGKSIAALFISSDKKRRGDAEVYLENSSTRRWL